MLLIVTGFVVVEYHELNQVEQFPDYFDHIVPYMMECNLDEIPVRSDGMGSFTETRAPLKWWSLCFSHLVLGNERILPFLYSIVLIPVTFSFANHLTQRKVVGLLTVLVLVTSGTFTTFDTTATYEQSWVVFLMLSLIGILRRNPIMMLVCFVLALASKPIAIIYIPAMFGFMIYKHDYFSISVLGAVTIGVALFVLLSTSLAFGGGFEFNHEELLHGFYNWWFYLNASLLVAMTLPLVVWRLFAMRKKHPEAKPLLIAIFVIIISVPLIDGFTDQLNHSYRFVPMIIFVGIGLAMIVTNFVTSKVIDRQEQDPNRWFG